jgi:hypothetical protein
VHHAAHDAVVDAERTHVGGNRQAEGAGTDDENLVS